MPLAKEGERQLLLLHAEMMGRKKKEKEVPFLQLFIINHNKQAYFNLVL